MFSFFLQSGAECFYHVFRARLNCALRFPALDACYMFSRACYPSPIFPPLHIFPRLFSSHVFPPLLPVTCFATVVTRFIFSRACYPSLIFPPFQPFTCFPALVSLKCFPALGCNFSVLCSACLFTCLVTYFSCKYFPVFAIGSTCFQF